MDSAQQHRLPSSARSGQRLLGRRPLVHLAVSGLPRSARGGDAAPAHTGWTVWLAASLAVVALLTLTPEGRGWAWGSPAGELRWYLTGLDSSATVLQLTGNLALLTVSAALAVLARPALGRLRWLTVVSFAVGTGIELLQWALPLGRVVSPLDAVLNATGAVAVGLVVAQLAAAWHRECPGDGRPASVR